MASGVRPKFGSRLIALGLIALGIALFVALPFQPAWTLDVEETIGGFTADGSHFYTFVPSREGNGDLFGPIRLRDASTGIEVKSFCSDARIIQSLCSDDRRFLAAIVEPGQVHVIDFLKRDEICLDTEGVTDGYHLHFAPNGEMLQVRAAHVKLPDRSYLFDVASRQLVAKPDEVLAARFSPNGRQVAYWTKDGMCLWDRKLGQNVGAYTGQAGAVRFSLDGRGLLTWVESKEEESRRFTLWDSEAHRPLGNYLAMEATFVQAEFSPDGKWLVTCPEHSEGKQELAVRDSRSGKQVGSLPMERAEHRFLVHMPDSSGVIVVGRLKSEKKDQSQSPVVLTFIELPAGKKRWQRHFSDIAPVQLPGYQGMQVTDFRISPDSLKISAFITAHASWEVLDARNGNSIRTIPLFEAGSRVRYVYRPILSADGQWLLSNAQRAVLPSKWIPLWAWRWLPPPNESRTLIILQNVNTQEEVLRMDTVGQTYSYLAPDGQLVLGETLFGLARIHDRRLQAWSIPPCRPWGWIIAIPVALGAASLSIRYVWRRRPLPRKPMFTDHACRSGYRA